MEDELLTEVANLVDEKPSKSHFDRALTAARNYLQRRNRMKVASAEIAFGQAFSALQWMYPRDPFIIVAGAAAYIKSKDPNLIGFGVTRLKRALKPGHASNEADQVLLDKVRRYLEGLSYLEAFQYLEKPSMLEFEWKGPKVFKKDAKSLDNLPELVVLTEVKGIMSAQRFFRADRIRDFVFESWGSLGYDVLRVYIELLKDVLQEPDETQCGRLQDVSVKFWATIVTIRLNSICLEAEFYDIKNCLFWIDEVIGTPNRPGAYRFNPILAAEYPALAPTAVIPVSFQSQVEELQSLVLHHPCLDISNYQLSQTKIQCYRYGAGTLPVLLNVQRPDDCWLKLIESSYVATFELPFRNLPSNVGKGLRLTFDLMCTLAGIERVTHAQDGGVVLTGYCTALVPIRVVSEMERSIQWHLIEHKLTGNRFRAIHNRSGFWDLIPFTRLREPTIDNLKGPAFIAWTSTMEFKLGTELRAKPLTTTRLSSSRHQWRLTQRSLGLGVQGGPPNTVILSAQTLFTQTEISTVYRLTPRSSFDARIADQCRIGIFIYDEQRRTTWLCPQILLTLHLARQYVSKLGQVPLLPAFTFPTCPLDRQVEYLRQAIRDIRGKPVLGDDSFTYEYILTSIMEAFDEAYQHLADVPRTKLHDDLLGFEALHLLYPGRTISPKILRTKGSIKSWSGLVEKGDIVFCSGLGEAIVSIHTNNEQCGHSLQPISHQDVLVCPVYLLNELFEENSCRRTAIENAFPRGQPYAEKTGPGGYRWVLTDNPFECAARHGQQDENEQNSSHACWKRRLQQVISTSALETLKRTFHPIAVGPKVIERFRPNGKTNEIPAFPDEGAICFGCLTKFSSESEGLSKQVMPPLCVLCIVLMGRREQRDEG